MKSVKVYVVIGGLVLTASIAFLAWKLTKLYTQRNLNITKTPLNFQFPTNPVNRLQTPETVFLSPDQVEEAIKKSKEIKRADLTLMDGSVKGELEIGLNQDMSYVKAVLGGLPELEKGMFYQLWLFDSQTNKFVPLERLIYQSEPKRAVLYLKTPSNLNRFDRAAVSREVEKEINSPSEIIASGELDKLETAD